MSDYDNNNNNNNNDYNESAARFAGDTVGSAGKSSTSFPPFQLITNTHPTTEGDYDRADQSVNNEEQSIGNTFRRDEQDIENAPENAVRDVEDVPSDIGGGLRGAANWVGDKIGGVKKEGQRAESDVQNNYNDAEQDVDRAGQGVQNDYNSDKQDVDQFGQGMQGSYDQGEQQGRQDGW